MSKTALAVDEMLEQEYSEDLEADDYCFIFDREGNLKGAVLPDVLPFKAPKNIAKILKLIGVRDIQDLEQEYNLH
jgi:hypothetical protein